MVKEYAIWNNDIGIFYPEIFDSVEECIEFLEHNKEVKMEETFDIFQINVVKIVECEITKKIVPKWMKHFPLDDDE